MKRACVIAIVSACLGACCGAALADDRAVAIPGGAPGIGFDDLRYSMALHRLLVPGGRAGVLALVDPDDTRVTTVAGFSTLPAYGGGHDDGVTSVDEGAGLLYVTDRTTQRLHAIRLATRAVVASARLAAHPDYVRWVAPTHEVWVTEPDAEQNEVFALHDGATPTFTSVATIRVPDGPESLVIDPPRGRAYTHHWHRATVAIDLRTRAITGEWPNGCAGSRGIALEPEHGFVLAACSEGTISVLDAAHGGRILSRLSRGRGYDVIGYNPALRHAYAAGGACRCLTVLGLSTTGALSLLGTSAAPADTHCVTADDRGNAWVCAPSTGSVRRVSDRYPATR